MNAMLEHQKKVLSGVSNNPYLFRKELVKSFKWLNVSEIEDFKKWVRRKFGELYPQLISEVFCGLSA